MIKNQTLPPARVIAIDVDGTLQIQGKPNTRLIEWCKERKAEGFFLMLWSARGQAHATKYAELFGIADVFDLICSKPGYIVDDQGWGWVKYTKVIRSLGEEIE
jgi:hydroxymethylpyrimidine pyrophosphatase-like HAD family hydrolase